MKFKRNNRIVDTIATAIEDNIENTYSAQGLVEDHEKKIRRCAEIIGLIAQQLPPNAIANVAEMMGLEIIEEPT